MIKRNHQKTLQETSVKKQNNNNQWCMRRECIWKFVFVKNPGKKLKIWANFLKIWAKSRKIRQKSWKFRQDPWKSGQKRRPPNVALLHKMAPNICRNTREDLLLEVTPKEGLHDLCGRRQKSHKHFSRKFGEIWANYPLHPQKVSWSYMYMI